MSYLFCDSLSNNESNVSLMVGLPIPSNPSSSKEGAGVTVNEGQRSFSTSSFKSDSKIRYNHGLAMKNCVSSKFQ